MLINNSVLIFLMPQYIASPSIKNRFATQINFCGKLNLSLIIITCDLSSLLHLLSDTFTNPPFSLIIICSLKPKNHHFLVFPNACYTFEYFVPRDSFIVANVYRGRIYIRNVATFRKQSM